MIQQYTNTIRGGSRKGHFRLNGGLWWKDKYLTIKTKRQLFSKLICNLCIYLTEINWCLHSAAYKQSFCIVPNQMFLMKSWPIWKARRLTLKPLGKTSLKLLCNVSVKHRELNLYFDSAVRNELHVESTKGYFRLNGGLWWKDKYLQIKTTRMHFGKLLWNVCIHHPEFNWRFYSSA